MANFRLDRDARRWITDAVPPAMANIRLGRHAQRWIAIGVVVVVIAGGGATAWAITGPSGPGYRTATVARANVTQTLVSTGTIEPVSQANVSFPVSGQVASVSVGLGTHVTAGQVLARLSTTALASQVSAAQYTVATATARVAADEASQTTTTAYITGGSGSGAATSGSGGTGGTGGSSGTITKLQAAVLAAQKRLDADLAAAKALVATETNLCAATSTPPGGPSGPASPSPTATPTTSRSSTSPTQSHSATPTTSATLTIAATPMAFVSPGPTGGPAGGPQPTTCQAAITDVLSAQNAVAADEQSLASAESALSQALSKLSTTTGKGSGGTGTGTGTAGAGSHGGGTGTTGGGATGGTSGGSTGAPATAAQLAADQASLDAANAQLSVARQDMAAATLVAPITGTVAMVNVTSGQQVTGSQGTGTTANFVIEGPGGQDATTTVTSTDVGEIRVGQPATVTLDGSTTSISGEVVSIGILAGTSSTGTASYPVTIGLAAGAPTLFAGSDAQVSITLAEVHDTIAVPTSAVQSLGAVTFVTVLQAGKPVRVRVVVGATGPTLTQISSGLTVGEQVVLADMSTPLPTNTNPFAARGLTGGGGFVGVRPVGGTTGGGAKGG